MAIEIKNLLVRKWWLWIALFLLVLVVVSLLKPDDTQTVSATEKEATKPIEPEVINSTLGKPVEITDTIFTIHSTERLDSFGDEYNSFNAKGEFVIVDIEIKNESKGAITTDPSIFKLRKNDVQFESDTTVSAQLNDGTGFYMQLLNPGLSIRSKIAFDIPKGTDNLKLYILAGQNMPVGIVNLQ